MSLLFLFLSYALGLLVTREPLFLLLFLFLLYRQRHRKKLLGSMFVTFIIGFITLFLLRFLGSLPFHDGYALVTKTGSNYVLVTTFTGKYYINLPKHTFVVGDVLSLTGTKESLVFNSLEMEFNFRQYLETKGVMSGLKLSRATLIVSSPLRYLLALAKGGPQYPPYLENIKRLLLLRDINYDDVLIKTLTTYNTLYVLMLSGVHLSFLRRVFKKVFLIFLSEDLSDHLSYLILVPFFILNITKFAFYRIFVTKIARILNKKRFFNSLEINVMVASFFLVIDPYLIFDVAFYLSYLLVFIYLLFPFARGLKGKLMRTLIFYLVLSSYFVLTSNSVTLTSFLYPLLVTPLVSFWYLVYVSTYFLGPLQNIGVNVLAMIYFVIAFLNTLNLVLYLPELSVLFRLSFVLFVSVLFYSLSIKLIPLRNNVVLTVLLLFAINFLPFENNLMYSVTFINVGQGDATLFNIRGKSVLIDTGGLKNKDIAERVLVPFLHKKRVYALDYIIITHDDFDHNGALPSLIEHFRVNRVITTSEAFPFMVNGVEFYNLNPGGYGEKNLDSLIFHVKFKTFNILMMGDAGVENEHYLLKNFPSLEVDILKVGHHGSNTSTSDAFVAHYQPKSAIISVGATNFYGHPHPDVIATLKKYDVTIYRTDTGGSITFKDYVNKGLGILFYTSLAKNFSII